MPLHVFAIKSDGSRVPPVVELGFSFMTSFDELFIEHQRACGTKISEYDDFKINFDEFEVLLSKMERCRSSVGASCAKSIDELKNILKLRNSCAWVIGQGE